MKRRALATTLAIGWTGLALAADPLPLPTAGEVITLKTAGQPERKVRVLKAERTADGTVLTDVKDLASGLVFTLTDARGSASKPSPTPAVAKPSTPTLPGTVLPVGPTVPGGGYTPPAVKFPALTDQPWGKLPTPLFGGSGLTPTPSTPAPVAGKPVSVTAPTSTPRVTYSAGPQAKTWEVDPLLAAVASSRPEPAPLPAKTPTLFGKLFGWGKPDPAPRVGGSAMATAVPTRPAPVAVLPSANAAAVRPLFPSANASTIRPPMYATVLPAPSAQQTAAARMQRLADDGPVLATAPPRSPAVRPSARVPAALAGQPIEVAAKPAPVPATAPTPVPPPADAEPVLTIAPPVLTASAPPPAAASAPALAAPDVIPTPVFDPNNLPSATAAAIPAEAPKPEPVKLELPPPPAPPTTVAVAPPVEVAKPEPPPPVAVAVAPAPAAPTPSAFEKLAPLPPLDPPIAVAASAPPATPPRVVAAPLPEPVSLPAPEAQPTASPDDQMRAELSETVQTLRSHTRPRVRLDAASALANGRYASRLEVQAVILDAARTDPNPVVRGHCVKLLAQLGVTDQSYQEDLLKWANDREPAVSRAAADALQKLAGK